MVTPESVLSGGGGAIGEFGFFALVGLAGLIGDATIVLGLLSPLVEEGKTDGRFPDDRAR